MYDYADTLQALTDIQTELKEVIIALRKHARDPDKVRTLTNRLEKLL